MSASYPKAAASRQRRIGASTTAKGRARTALSAYLRVLDRQHRLAVVLRLERRVRQVEEVDRYLDRFARAEHE